MKKKERINLASNYFFLSLIIKPTAEQSYKN